MACFTRELSVSEFTGSQVSGGRKSFTLGAATVFFQPTGLRS